MALKNNSHLEAVQKLIGCLLRKFTVISVCAQLEAELPTWWMRIESGYGRGYEVRILCLFSYTPAFSMRMHGITTTLHWTTDWLIHCEIGGGVLREMGLVGRTLLRTDSSGNGDGLETSTLKQTRERAVIPKLIQCSAALTTSLLCSADTILTSILNELCNAILLCTEPGNRRDAN